MLYQQTTFVTPPPAWPGLPESQRPINRIREVGPQALSIIEVLSVLLGQTSLEVASRIVAEFPTLGELVQATALQLAEIQGVGPVSAAKIHAALELGRRFVLESTPAGRYDVRQPEHIANLIIPLIGHAAQENFVVVCLNTRNQVLYQRILYTGTLNTTLVRMAEVFEDAVQRKAAAIIIAHNHPSGNAEPSPEDISLTRRLVDAGKILEIDLLDHLVVAGNRWISLRQRGLGFEQR